MHIHKRKTFFIVDDDIDDQELFKEALTEVDSSIDCISFSDCEAALRTLKSVVEPLPDVIFLDLNMPRLNGKQCLAELKKTTNLRHIPVIIYSTSSEKNDVEETFKLGAAYFLTKPNKFTELRRLLKDVIARDWAMLR